MSQYAILCGSAPEGFRQRKIEYTYDFLIRETGKSQEPEDALVLPSGVSELFLEGLLNEVFDKAAEEDDGGVILYLCAQTESDLHSQLSDCAIPDVEVIRLGENEIRKEVLSYYADLAEKLGIKFCIKYDTDCDFVRDEEFGWEKI
ncbi:MAG: hypothetical protein IJ727_07455 [Treponema sp.]|nr:hypothetical protein [Treponema sp.]